jgi:hypothetical protein
MMVNAAYISYACDFELHEEQSKFSNILALNIHPNPFYVITPNITSSIMSPNPRKHMYLIETYLHIVTITFVNITKM